MNPDTKPDDYWPDGVPSRATEHVLDNFPYQVWSWCVLKKLHDAEGQLAVMQGFFNMAIDQRDQAEGVLDLLLHEIREMGDLSWYYEKPWNEDPPTLEMVRQDLIDRWRAKQAGDD